MDESEIKYKEWSKRVRADATEHCSTIWNKDGRGGNWASQKHENTKKFNPRIVRKVENNV